MTNRRLTLCLTFATFAYMAAFAAPYIDRLMPVFRQVAKALGG